MPGMSLITALEIFTNPYDLEIVVGQEEKKDGKYVLIISRGPGHNFKRIISSEPFAEKLEDAIEKVKKVLELAQQIAMNEFGNKESVISRILNPDNQPINQSKVLNSELIARIVDDLQLFQVASTYRMFPGVQTEVQSNQ